MLDEGALKEIAFFAIDKYSEEVEMHGSLYILVLCVALNVGVPCCAIKYDIEMT